MRKHNSSVYRVLCRNLYKRSEKILLINVTGDRVRHTVKEILDENPGLFWFEGKIKIEQKGIITRVYPHYVYTGSECEEIKACIEEAVSRYIDNSYVNELHLIKEVYRDLLDNVSYDMNAPHSQNISSVFAYKRSVCKGISKAFQYILQRKGVFCRLVEGTIDNNEHHVWNIVRVLGEYYHVDVALGCDCFAPLWQDPQAEVFRNGFFCVSTRKIEKTHKIFTNLEDTSCNCDLVV